MAKLIYSMITSLDGYAEAAEGDLGRGAEDEEVHTFIGDAFRTSARTSTADGCTRRWSSGRPRTPSPTRRRTSCSTRATGRPRRRSSTPRRWRRCRARRRGSSGRSTPTRSAAQGRGRSDLTVDGPNLAAQAIAAGLVDEYHLFITTSVVGGGKRFFPDGVRLDLDLVEERAFDSGLVYARYRTR